MELENKKKKNIESEMEEGTFALGDVNNAIKLVFLIRISVRKCIVRKLGILKVKKIRAVSLKKLKNRPALQISDYFNHFNRNHRSWESV